VRIQKDEISISPPCFPAHVFIALLRGMLQGNDGREMAKWPHSQAKTG
jgi:hypothetical protein